MTLPIPSSRRVRTSMVALAVLAATSLAHAAQTLALRIEPSPDHPAPAMRVTCEKESSGNCVLAIGERGGKARRTLWLAPGASTEIPHDETALAYCANVNADALAWPDCLGNSGTSGDLATPRTIRMNFF